MFKGALVRPSVMDDLLVILFSFSPLSYRLQLLIPHQLAHIPRTRLTWLLALGNPEHSKGNGQHQRQHHGQGQGEDQEQGGTDHPDRQQGGRTWQPFVGSKNGNENFRQTRIYNFRVKCVVFARNRKFAKLTQ